MTVAFLITADNALSCADPDITSNGNASLLDQRPTAAAR